MVLKGANFNHYCSAGPADHQPAVHDTVRPVRDGDEPVRAPDRPRHQRRHAPQAPHHLLHSRHRHEGLVSVFVIVLLVCLVLFIMAVA